MTEKCNGKQNIYEMLCWGVIALTAILMIVLGSSENLWYDEAYTTALIQHPIKEIVEITSHDVHSPFYYILAKFFFLLCGQRIQAVKWFSVLFLVLFEVVVKFAVSAIWDRRSALYSLLLLLALPCVAVHAADGRMYTMGLFFVGLSAVLAYLALSKSHVGLWVLFTLSCVATMYVHIFTMIAMFFLFLILFVCLVTKKWRSRKNVLCYLGSGVVSVCAYLPWLLIVLQQFGTVKDTSMYGDTTAETYTEYWVQWFSSNWNPNWKTVRLWRAMLLLAVLLYGGMVLLSVWKKEEKVFFSPKHKLLPGVMLLMAALPTVFGIVFSFKVTTVYMGRYSFPLLGLVCVFMGVIFASIRFRLLPICLTVLLLVCGAKNYCLEYSRQTDDGMKEFLTFSEEMVGEKDAYVVDSIHTSLFCLYEGEHPYYYVGPVQEMNPFPMKSFVNWEDLGDTKQLYLLSFNEEVLNLWPFADYPSRIVKEFDYMMYHVKIYEIDYGK